MLRRYPRAIPLPFREPHQQQLALAVGPAQQRVLLLRRNKKGDLFTAFIDAANSGTPEDVSTAAYLVSVCLPYASGSSKPYPLDKSHYEKLSAAGAAGRLTNREQSAEKLFGRCKGFGDKARLTETMKVLSAQLTQAGVVGVFGPVANDSQRREAEATIEKVFQNPGSYLGVLMANTNEIFPRLGSALDDATTGAAESRLAFELGMCQLGSDRGRDSISAMNACVITGVCTESTVQEKASQLARAYGFDFERIERMADAFAGGVRRADTSVLGYRR